MAASPALSQEQLVAIDVLLVPDQTMLDASAEWNARMRAQTPDGFELDETHQPHVTLIQRHVLASDLDAVLAAVSRVRADFDIGSLTMQANGIYHIPTGDQGLAGITITPSKALLELQAAVIEAVNPFDAGAADESAYVPDPTGTPFDPFLFQYVETFVPEQTGDKYNPHVTIGIAPAVWLEEVESRPFDAFEFGATGLAVYQLGNFGTASLRLDE
jgi:2'-5' RNA ligase superfamily